MVTFIDDTIDPNDVFPEVGTIGTVLEDCDVNSRFDLVWVDFDSIDRAHGYYEYRIAPYTGRTVDEQTSEELDCMFSEL